MNFEGHTIQRHVSRVPPSLERPLLCHMEAQTLTHPDSQPAALLALSLPQVHQHLKQ